jgi:hypothetical protein
MGIGSPRHIEFPMMAIRSTKKIAQAMLLAVKDFLKFLYDSIQLCLMQLNFMLYI